MLHKSLTRFLPLAPTDVPWRSSRSRPWSGQRRGNAHAVAATFVLAVSFLYAVAILVVPGFPSLRSFPLEWSAGAAVGVDLLLLLLALLHFHLVQRPYAVLTSAQINRSSSRRTQDRLLASALLFAFFFAWQPLPELAWSLTAARQVMLAQIGAGAGWGLLVVSAALMEVPTFLRFALRLLRVTCPAPALRLLRTGIAAAVLLIEWSAPQMSYGHLLFATAVTVYIVLVSGLSRRDVKHAI
jgi:hypothetical protein